MNLPLQLFKMAVHTVNNKTEHFSCKGVAYVYRHIDMFKKRADLGYSLNGFRLLVFKTVIIITKKLKNKAFLS